MVWELWDDPTLGHSHFREHFFGDIVTILDILHWDTLHLSMVDFWDDGLFWDTVASDIAHGRHSHSILFVEHGVIRVCWDYIGIFIYSIDGWDWPYSEDTCWDIALSLAMDFDLSWSIVTLDGLYWGISEMENIFHWSIANWILYTRAYPSFGEISVWFFTLEHLRVI